MAEEDHQLLEMTAFSEILPADINPTAVFRMTVETGLLSSAICFFTSLRDVQMKMTSGKSHDLLFEISKYLKC